MTRPLQVIVFGVIACAQAAGLLIVVGHHFGGIAPFSLNRAGQSDSPSGYSPQADATETAR